MNVIQSEIVELNLHRIAVAIRKLANYFTCHKTFSPSLPSASIAQKHIRNQDRFVGMNRNPIKSVNGFRFMSNFFHGYGWVLTIIAARLQVL
jgi:hypothetical protein